MHRQAALPAEGVPRRRGHGERGRAVPGAAASADGLHLLAARPGPDVEVDHRAGVVAEVPHGLEVGLGELGQAEQLGLVRHGEAPHAAIEEAGGLPDGEVHVPHGQEALREEAVPRLLLHLHEEVVVDLQDRGAHLGVLDGEHVVGGEADPVGVQHLGVDAHEVEQLEALLHGPGGGVDRLEGLQHVLAEDLLPTLTDGVAPGAGPHLPVEVPGGLPLDGALDRHAVAHRGRRPGDPQVGGLGEVRVAVDDPQAVQDGGNPSGSGHPLTSPSRSSARPARPRRAHLLPPGGPRLRRTTSGAGR